MSSVLYGDKTKNLFFLKHKGVCFKAHYHKDTKLITCDTVYSKDLFEPEVGWGSVTLNMIESKESQEVFYGAILEKMFKGLRKTLYARVAEKELPNRGGYFPQCSVDSRVYLSYETQNYAWYTGEYMYNLYHAIFELDKRTGMPKFFADNQPRYIPNWLLEGVRDELIRRNSSQEPAQEFFAIYCHDGAMTCWKSAEDDATITYIIQQPNSFGVFSYDQDQHKIAWSYGSDGYLSQTPEFQIILANWCRGFYAGRYLMEYSPILLCLERIAEVMREEERLVK